MRRVLGLLCFGLLACGGNRSDDTRDAGVTSCGDGVLTGDELCDSDTVSCAGLALSYSSGQATCRSDCSGYVVTTCTVNTAVKGEVVRPAERSSRWVNARCNDGTTFNFSVNPSPTGSSEWAFMFEGGGFCDGTNVSCKSRAKRLVSSADEPNDRASVAQLGNGAISRDPQSRVKEANIVSVNYCSSDLYTGTRTATVTLEGRPLYFSGRLNVIAMLEVLRQRYGLDDSNPATKVLYLGGSAGGNGVRNTVDVLARMLPNARAGKRIRLAPKAGFMPLNWNSTDIRYSLAGSGQSDRAFFETTATLWQSVPSPECAALATAAGEPPSVCAAGLFAVRATIRPVSEGGMGIPDFELQSRRDFVYALGLHGLNTPALLSPWDAMVAAELRDSGLRWQLTPSVVMHGLDGRDETPYPAFNAASSSSCDATAYASPMTYSKMLTAFFDDPNPDTSVNRVCFDDDWQP